MTRKRYPAWVRRRRQGAPDGGAIEELAVALAMADEGAIRAVLHPDVVLIIDSGGSDSSVPTPPAGQAAVSSALMALMAPGTSVALASMNGVPGVIVTRAEEVVAAVSADMRSGLVSTVWVVCNPDKLRHWNGGSEGSDPAV